jgi:tRNA dimethylallyltransferase
MERRVITILGCTASGKGGLARALASELGGEILSVDSMKVYRGMDIGTAKPTPEQRAEIRHHLIDVADPWESFSAARFVELADRAVAEVHVGGKPLIAVGGTVLYFKCFYEGMFAGPSADPVFRAEIRARAEREGLDALHAELARVDPQAATRIHRNDLRRIERAREVHHLTGHPISELQKQWDDQSLRRPGWDWRLIGLRRDKEDASRRINERVRRMVAAGLVEEARQIWTDPRGASEQAGQAVGYAELFDHFEGGVSLEEAIERIKINSRRLAKQQRTWLKRLAKVHWIDVEEQDDVASIAVRVRPILKSSA